MAAGNVLELLSAEAKKLVTDPAGWRNHHWLVTHDVKAKQEVFMFDYCPDQSMLVGIEREMMEVVIL
jgi:hypothetical protein